MDVKRIHPPKKRCSIICSNLPTELLDKTLARIYFRQFGRVTRIIIRPRSRACIIEYDCPENAQLAILNGGEYKSHIFCISWYDQAKTKKKKIQKDPDPNWLPEVEVQAELEAMSATGGYNLKSPFSLRSKAMDVEKRPASKVKKTLKKVWKSELGKKLKPKSKGILKKPNVTTSEQLELLSIIKQPALTIEEKLKVLEARDKLIRLQTKKENNLKNARPTVGTCPDMCPEKERLMRVVQHQVAIYEQDLSGKNMNPALAIKQYSRSSADQEVPLPHELRPVSVLQFTMRYLMDSIMNLCDTPDVNLGEWYHFLWDRTRSIRKDITQQELCCQGSVALLEQCARFHIHCSARLAGEDPSVFDQKINTENLTKCLQTLKYLYHDLNLRGEVCPNESEFRAYIILLNLNDGNFMWEVQQLKPEIQRSPEVRFALSVYSAIDKNNFIKFFKLVRSTGYLNACILLRYFVQVRTKALLTILKSYSPRAPYTNFPLHEFVKLLAFEDSESAVEFLVAHGLYLNPEETHIVLDKKNFQPPEIPCPMDRAINVVESKRKALIGETVCGNFLPPLTHQIYTPHNSFDENGLLNITDMIIDLTETSQDINILASKHAEDEPDSVELVKPSQSTIDNPFGSKPTSLFDEPKKVSDMSQPFWSIKTDTATTTANIFQNKNDLPSTNIFRKNPEPLQTFTFKSPAEIDQQKSNIFGDQSKSIFAGRQQKSSIFGTPQTFTSSPMNTYDTQSTVQQKSSIFQIKPSITDHMQIPTTSIFATGTKQPKPGGFAFNLKLNEGTQSVKTPNLELGAGRNNIFKLPFAEKQKPLEFPKSSHSEQNPVEQRANIFNVEKSFTVPSVKQSNEAEDLEKLEKAKLEEMEKERKAKRDMEEQLKREIEEKKKLEKLLKEKKLEEERREKERRKIELEKEKKKAELEKLKKKIELEEHKKKIELEKRKQMEAFALTKEIRLVMNDLLDKVEENVKQKRLMEISLNIAKHKMHLFIQKWHKKSISSKRKRQAIDCNPIWLPMRTTNEEAQELYTTAQDLNLLNFKRYKCGKCDDIPLPVQDKIPTMNIKSICNTLIRTYLKTHQRLQKEIFWKVTVSLPDSREMKFGLNKLEEILMEILQWKERYGGTSVVNQFVGETRFNYAIEKKQGVHPFEDNSDGIVFISYKYHDFLIERIREGFKNYSRLSCVPVIIIFINNDTNYSINHNLMRLLNSIRHVTSYEILTSKFTNVEITDVVDKSLISIAEDVEPSPPLEFNTLQSFIYINAASELWKRVSAYSSWNYSYKKCLRSPNVVISLYNEAIEKLKGLALDSQILQYKNFPDEFDKLLLDKVPDVLPCDYKYFPSFWKSDSYRCLLLNTINTLKLPRYQACWPPISEVDLERDLFNYCSEIFQQPERTFFKAIAIILRNIDPSVDFKLVDKVLWTDVIEIIIEKKLEETDFSFQHTQFNGKSIFSQLFVVYNRESLDSYIKDEWFYMKNSTIESELKNIKHKKKPKIKEKHTDVNLYETFDLDELERSILNNDRSIVYEKSNVEELKNLMDDLADLEDSMAIQKKICSTFQKAIGISSN